MSIFVMAKVWKDYPGAGGSEMLALLALADWSDDEGRCWPSMAAIAAKTRLSRSQAQRVVHSLIADGYLYVLGNADGGKPGSTRQYQINLGALTGRTDAAPMDAPINTKTGSADATPTGRIYATGSAHATGRTDAAEGPHGCDPNHHRTINNHQYARASPRYPSRDWQEKIRKHDPEDLPRNVQGSR